MGDGWTALIVDESATAREGLAQILGDAGAQVVVAGTVNEAFAALIDTRIDLALIALEVPPEGGLTILEQLRSEGERHVPVIITSWSATADAAPALRQGADDFLRHPLVAIELVERCQRLLRHYRRFSELEAQVVRLHELSVTDGLTQVANHRFFQERLTEEFRRAQRYDDPLALILADLDHFKEVNDRYGHPAGDLVLKAIAELFGSAVRETDFVARYGGEEFAVLLPKTHLGGALTVAERVSLELRKRKIGPSAVRVTASFGISSFPNRGVGTAEQLLKTADEALYRAKSEGRNCISLHQAPHPVPASH